MDLIFLHSYLVVLSKANYLLYLNLRVFFLVKWSESPSKYYICSSNLDAVYCLPQSILPLTIFFISTRTLIWLGKSDLRVSRPSTCSRGTYDLPWAVRYKKVYRCPYQEERSQGDCHFSCCHLLPALGLLTHLVTEKAREVRRDTSNHLYVWNYYLAGRSPSCFRTVGRVFSYFQRNSIRSEDLETVNTP